MPRTFVALLAIVSLLLVADPSAAQQAKAKATPKAAKAPAKAKVAKAPNPAYAQIEDVPGLPRVLILGDSISIGYMVAARDELKGEANVHRPATNCGPTIRGLQAIDAWLGDGKWDVIHFNFGLHDLKFIDDAGKNTSPDKGHHQVSPEDYEKNLQTLVERLKKTGAKLIFATTTPVPPGAAARVKGDADKYNAIARRVMEKNGVAIDDLYGFALPKLAEIQRPKDVHFTAAGSKVLARQVAASIRAELPKK